MKKIKLLIAISILLLTACQTEPEEAEAPFTLYQIEVLYKNGYMKGAINAISDIDKGPDQFTKRRLSDSIEFREMWSEIFDLN